MTSKTVKSNAESGRFQKVYLESRKFLIDYFDDKDLYGGEHASGENHPMMIQYYQLLYEAAQSK